MEEVVKQPKPFLKKKFIPYFLIGFWTIITLCLGAFFVETLAVLNDPVTSWMNDVEFYIVLAATLVNLVGYLTFVHRHFRIKIHWPLFAIFVVLFGANLVGLMLFPEETHTVWSYPSGSTINVDYILTMTDKIRYMFTFEVECIYFYLFFALFPKVFRNKRAINWVMYLVLAVCVISIIFSLCKEFECYSQYIKETIDPAHIKSAMSFTNNRNTYGFCLLLGILAAAYLNANDHRFFYWIFMGVFYFELFFVLSKTSIIFATIFLLIYIGYRFGKTVKYHAIKSSLALLLFIGFVGGIVLLVTLPAAKEIKFFDNLHKAFEEAMFNSKSGTLYARVHIWNFTVQQLFNRPTDFIFGIGKGNYGWYFGIWQHHRAIPTEQGFAHNGFLQMFAEGGIIKLVVYTGVVAYMIYVVVHNFMRKRRGTLVSLLMFAVIIGHGWSESTNFLRVDTIGITTYAMCLLPLLIDYRMDKHPEVAKVLEENAKESKPAKIYIERNGASSATLFFVLFAPLAAAFFGTMHGWRLLGYGVNFDAMYVYITLGILFLIEPLTYYHIGYIAAKRKLLSVANFLLIGVSVVVIFALPNLIGTIIVLVINLIIFAATFFASLQARRVQPGGYFFYKVYLPYLAITGALVACNVLVIVLMKEIYLTKFALGALIGLDFFALVCFKVYLPTSRRLDYPVSGFLYKFETRVNERRSRIDKKIDIRERKYFMSRRCRKAIRYE